MLQPSGLITLLTDFGDRDAFVASMKGVILTINPHATLVDLTHQVPTHSVEDAAYLLKSCYRCFPKGTVHVAVVDPGVGSARRPLIAKSEHYFFLAPDNGLLTPILAEDSEMEVREIENANYRLTSPGRTFDGRDLFAPAAAWLTAQQPFASFGRLIDDCKTFTILKPKWDVMALVGEIVHIDRFGNLITNLTTRNIKEVQELTKRPNPLIRVAGCLIDRLVASYSQGDAQSPQALVNSDGYLEIFLKESSAAARLHVSCHEPVTLS
ncbi:MAG TPA: SAM-dependent chlorinase/fluorinase [Nitrospiraceae bacterium]|nr:SAM-dependent chlorinase/fluorinase [Nitrospiraceae bacterium]